MPDMDGFDFLQALKGAPAHMNIPVIMVTGKIFSDDQTLRAYQYGAVDFLLKPLDAQVVYRKVSFFVDQARRIKNFNCIDVHLKNLSRQLIFPLEQLIPRILSGAVDDDSEKIANELQLIIKRLKTIHYSWRFVQTSNEVSTQAN